MSVRDSRTLEIAIESARKEAQDLTDENQARLAQLITVWICGYLEVTCRDVLLSYVEEHSDDASVARFASQNLRRIRNPSTEGILELVKSFDKDRAEVLNDFIQGRVAESVNSVVKSRQGIAHGRPVGGLTIEQVWDQFDDSRKLAAKMRELFDGAK